MSMDFKAPLGWHIAYGVSCILLLAASVIIVLRDYYPPWMTYQSEFHRLYYQKLKAEHDAEAAKDPRSEKVRELQAKMIRARRAPLEVKQLYLGSTQWLSEYKAMVERVDRCTTCHMAADYAVQSSFKSALALFGQEKHPFIAHSYPELMSKHDPGKMGCTLCHGGQGRAVKAVTEAHGQVRFWEQPLLNDRSVYNDMKNRRVVDPLTPSEHIQAACAKCHLGTGPLEGAPLLSLGRKLFDAPVIKGNPNCLACHRIGGQGTSLSAELTEAGNRFRDAEGWMRAHFRDIYPEAMAKMGVKKAVDVWTAPPHERYVYYTKWVYEHFLNPQLFMPGYYITQEDARNNVDNPDIYVFSSDAFYLRRYAADDRFIEVYAVPEQPKDWDQIDITLRGLRLVAVSNHKRWREVGDRPFDLKLRLGSGRTSMPPYPFTEEEAKAMTVLVLGWTGEQLPPQYVVQPQAVVAAASAPPTQEIKLPKGDADAGKALFNAKGCQACHRLTAEKLVGPGLQGVTGRRDKAWLARWMKDPPAMVAADPKLKNWVKEFSGVIMPPLGLQDKEIADLIAFMETLK